MNQNWLPAIASLLCWLLPPAAFGQQAVGAIPGSFDVTLTGSATYAIPLRIAPGTAGLEPKISLVYDSQAPSGPLGAGWSIAGLSVITRGPKNARLDSAPDGVKMAESDALYLDGQRLVGIRSDGSGTNRTIEYRKEMDDQTRILEIGADFGSAKFIVNTKGGLRIEFVSDPGAPQGENRGDVRFADGSVLLRAETRVSDTSGNFIDFYYVVNGNGNYDIKTIRYTGHEASASETVRAPYASIEFNYEAAPRSQQTFVAGRTLIIDTRLKEIVCRVESLVKDTVRPGWMQVAHYLFDYEDRETANRFVLKTLHQFGEDQAELVPTTFLYSAPRTSWASAKRYALPAILAKHEELAAGYRFAHVSSSRRRLPDLLYAAQVDGQLEAFAFQNKGDSWAPLEVLKPPIAFTRADGADLGVILADVNGDGRADLLQSYASEDGTVVRNSFLAGKDRWDRDTGYDLPFLVAKHGKVVARYEMAYWTDGPGPDLIYQSEGKKGFLTNTGDGWQPDDRYSPPSDMNTTWTVDVDCSGKPSLVAAVRNPTGQIIWKVYKFAARGWEEVTSDSFKFPFNAGVDSRAVRIVSIEGSACPGILVATAQNGGLHAFFQASRSGWKELADRVPPFDLVDATGNSADAVVASVSGHRSSDIFANRLFPDGHTTKFMYFQKPTGWEPAPSDYYIPVLHSGAEGTPNYVSVADLTGDGRADVAFPSNSRQRFGRIFVASDGGFKERLEYVPPVSFARQDHQDQGVRLIDLNGDGLPDLLVSRSGVNNRAGAWLNTGSGWKSLPALTPPVPFAGDDIAGNPVQFVDVDGDGYLDLLYAYRDKNGTTTHFYRNVPADGGSRKWSDASSDGSNLSGLVPPTDYPFAAEKIGDLGVRFADVTGTGRPFMLVGLQLAGASPKLTAFRNDGSKWIEAPEYAPPVPFVAQVGTATDPSRDLAVQIVDINGDGLPDIVAKYHDPTNPSNVVEGVWLNTGHGWEKSPAISVPVALDLLTFDQQNGYQWEKNTTIQWADLNGDGLPDIIYSRREGTTNKSVIYLGTGSGWTAAPEWQIPIEALPDRGGDTGFRLVDVNGDGYADLLYIRQDPDGSTKKGLYLNTGAGWLQKDSNGIPDLPFVDKDGNDLGVRLYDVDGRGLVDIIQSYVDNLEENDVQINQGRRSDVIRSIDAGLGLRTDIFYQSLVEGGQVDFGAAQLTLRAELRWPRVYEPGHTTIGYPIVAPVPPMYAVRRVIVSEGTSRKIGFSYRYGGFRMDALSKKGLGFAWRESVNEVTNILTHVDQTQDVRNAGRTLRDESCWLNFPTQGRHLAIVPNLCSRSGQGTIPWVMLLSRSENKWQIQDMSVGGASLPKAEFSQVSLAQSSSVTYELDRHTVESHTDEFAYDEPPPPHTLLDRRMNTLRTATTWGDHSKITTVNEYDADDERNWFFGRLTKSVITKTSSPCRGCEFQQDPQVSTVGFTYDQATGLLSSETINLGTTREATTLYKRDSFGNIVETRLHATGVADYAPTTYEYDGRHRFLASTTNSLGHKVTQEVSSTSGLPTNVSDANGVSALYRYDGFGRLIWSKQQTGTDTYITTTTQYRTIPSLNSSVPTSGIKAAYALAVQISDGTTTLPATIKLLDPQGRVLRAISEAFTKSRSLRRLLLRDTVFDELGRTQQVSAPYEMGQKPVWMSVTRDALGRVVKQTSGGGGTIVTKYSGTDAGGLIKTVTDLRPERPRTTITVTNMRGLPIRMTDDEKGSINYKYDPSGNPISVTDALGRTARYSYDTFGNRTHVSDPDAGSWQYKYDALGRLVRQTDSNNGSGYQDTAFEYDALGRIVRETTPTEVWTWEYDTATHGVGRVALVKDDANRFIERYSYDDVGRVHQASVTIGGETFTSSQLFDSFGRVARTVYPGDFAVDNVYDEKGVLEQVEDAQTRAPYWTLDSTDAAGDITGATYGNGVKESNSFDRTTGRPESRSAINKNNETIVELTLKYDSVGDLRHREDSTQHRSEDFGYDTMDRLTSVTRADGTSEHYAYDVVGRIRSKSGLQFVYSDDGLLNSSSQCNRSSPLAHAVIKTVSKQEERLYKYDCHGNMIASGGDLYAYSPDNRLIRTVSDPSKNLQRSVQFDYRPDGIRYREIARHGRRRLETVFLPGYERITEFGADSKANTPRFIRHRWYVSNGNGAFAVVERNREEFDNIAGFDHPGALHIGTSPVETGKIWYLHKDQLGQILAISDETGTARAHYWYDPWGLRTSEIHDPPNLPSGMRLEDSWSRGFLGQEHLQDFELIHLNGRVYDPVLGMFTSPDPLNQSPLDTQLWNPYSYSRNNPLRYVDPTGYDFWSDAGNVLSAPVRWVASGAQAVGQGVVHFAGEAGKWLSQNWRQVVVVAAVVVVTVVTLGSGGPAAASLGTAILAGMAAGATAGGLSAALYGGNLNDVLTGAVKGAVIGGLSAAAFYGIGELTAGGGFLNDLESVAGHGTVGGLQEVAYGGEFWRGFETGAVVDVTDITIPVSDSFALNTTRSALVGGTAASISGGDFANGAVTGAFSYAFNRALHSPTPINNEPEQDPYSLDDAFSSNGQINLGSSVGIGPKIYDVFGDPQYGFSTSCCGVGPGVGTDTIFGQTLVSPNISLSCPYQLCSAGVGVSYKDYNFAVSGSVRMGSVEGAYNSSVNVGRLYERVESSIYRLYGVPHY
jgi:RHS repeat-associated protein